METTERLRKKAIFLQKEMELKLEERELVLAKYRCQMVKADRIFLTVLAWCSAFAIAAILKTWLTMLWPI